MTGFIWTLVALIALFIFCTLRPRMGVMRMMRSRTLISDQSAGAWTLEWGSMWLVHFGEAWREQYGNTWAFGIGTEDVWYYSPREATRDRD